MIANFEGFGELLRGVTNPIQEVKDARSSQLERSVQDVTGFGDAESQLTQALVCSHYKVLTF